MAVIKNIIEGGVVNVASGGVTATRVFIVTDVTGDGDSRLGNATLVSGIPTYNQVHPAIPGIYAYDINAESAGDGCATTVRVTVKYQTPTVDNAPPSETEPPQISVGTTVQTVETNKDVNGDPMYVYNETYTAQGVPTGLNQELVTAQVEKPMTVLRFSRKEPVSPYLKSILFTGTLNAAPFLGQPAKTWICKGITGDFAPDKTGDAWRVTYEFQFNPSGWRVSFVYTAPGTGKPVDPTREGIELTTYDVYPVANFSALVLGA